MSTLTELEAPGLPHLASSGITVPLVTGGRVPVVHFDYGASAPVMAAVAELVGEFLPGYSAGHRGDGPLSLEATGHYEHARVVARRFLGAPDSHAIVWTENTTGAINITAHALANTRPRPRVVVFGMEHHANILPWQTHCDLTILPIPATHGDLLTALATELAREPADLVAVTGASNVTGECPDLAAIARITHSRGALLLADLAQLAPHHQVNMTELGIDIAVLSGHKMGAPYRVGVLAAPRDLLTGYRPLITGGGIVDFVHADGTVEWVDDPETLHEPGSPNVVGVLATATAMATLRRAGMDRVAGAEAAHLDLATALLGDVPGLQVHTMWPAGHPRIGVLTFNIDGIPWGLLAAVLSAEYGIATRSGCFCAHILMAHLLGVPLDEAKLISAARRSGSGVAPGAVRVSFGYDTTFDSIVQLREALDVIVAHGPGWAYVPCGDGHYRPDPDPRPARLDFAARTAW